MAVSIAVPPVERRCGRLRGRMAPFSQVENIRYLKSNSSLFARSNPILPAYLHFPSMPQNNVCGWQYHTRNSLVGSL